MLGGVNAAGHLIRKAVRKDAAIFFGMSTDHSLDDQVKLTLIATGLKEGAGASVTKRLRGFIPRFKAKDTTPAYSKVE